MLMITVQGYTKAVELVEETKSSVRFRVGLANVRVSKTGSKPYIWIPGKRYPEFKHYIPMIMEYVFEYKRLVSEPGNPAPISITDATPDAKYRYQKASPRENYVSSVPKWITEIKEWKVCSGPYRTYSRRVRVPEEYAETVEKYLPFCCQCQYRSDCDQPCLSPLVSIQEELFVG